MSSRPPVSVIVPFAGSEAELDRLRKRLEAIAHRAEDEIIVSDNRGHPLPTPAYARNRGAAEATGEWLLFLDADTIPTPGILDAYFELPPRERTAILAGAIEDDPPPGAGLVARHAAARGHLSHTQTLNRSGTPYAQTANCALRRSAFASVGGFEETARAGEDADLCFRLAQNGWKLEERPRAIAGHRPRDTLRGWLGQLVVHGAGAAWLERRWPGEFPRAGVRAFLARLGRHGLDAGRAVARADLQRAAFFVLDLVGACAFELGRLFPNERKPRVTQGAAGKQADRMTR